MRRSLAQRGDGEEEAERAETGALEAIVSPEPPGDGAESGAESQCFHATMPPRAAALSAVDLAQAVDEFREFLLGHH